MSGIHHQNCCLCQNPFQETNFPRLMTQCDHSACTKCLHSIFTNSIKSIICHLCQKEFAIVESSIDDFPKNISLTKAIKEKTIKKPSSITEISTSQKNIENSQICSSTTSLDNGKNHESSSSSENVDHESLLISQKLNASSQRLEKKQICKIHNKELELICLKDFTQICSLCGVFGIHKDHKELKTIEQTERILAETLKIFEETKSKKKGLESYIKNSDFKAQMTQKIGSVKSNLLKEIKDKFSHIRQVVQTAEKNAIDDLNKRFKEVNDKINKMVKEESEFEPLFNNWARTIELELVQTNRIGINFEEKAKIYYNGPVKSLSEGQFYLAHLESYAYEKKNRLESIPSLVSVSATENLSKQIFNHLTVKFDDCLPIAYDDILLASRVDKNLVTLETPVPETNHLNMSYSSNGKSASSNQISSTNSISQSPTATTKKPIKVQFSSSQNFLSPNKQRIQSPSYIQNNRPPREKSKSLPKHQPQPVNNLMKSQLSPKKQVLSNSKSVHMTEQRKRYLESSTEGIVQLFMADDKLDTLDLCAFDMPDNQIVLLLDYVNSKKRVKCLKLSQNRLTNEGFSRIVQYLKYTTNINVSSNLVTEEVLNILIRNREKLPNLRILNLAHNKVNERKAKVYVDELKKQGIIVTLS